MRTASDNPLAVIQEEEDQRLPVAAPGQAQTDFDVGDLPYSDDLRNVHLAVGQKLAKQGLFPSPNPFGEIVPLKGGEPPKLDEGEHELYREVVPTVYGAEKIAEAAAVLRRHKIPEGAEAEKGDADGPGSNGDTDSKKLTSRAMEDDDIAYKGSAMSLAEAQFIVNQAKGQLEEFRYMSEVDAASSIAFRNALADPEYFPYDSAPKFVGCEASSLLTLPHGRMVAMREEQRRLKQGKADRARKGHGKTMTENVCSLVVGAERRYGVLWDDGEFTTEMAGTVVPTDEGLYAPLEELITGDLVVRRRDLVHMRQEQGARH